MENSMEFLLLTKGGMVEYTLVLSNSTMHSWQEATENHTNHDTKSVYMVQ